MPERTASATWTDDLQSGDGRMALGSGAWEGPYSFASRFEDGEGSNPEELIGAAHAGCFSMALANALDDEGYEPEVVETEATVTLDPEDLAITESVLDCEAEVPDVDEDEFYAIAASAEENCPVSKVLDVETELDATLR